MSTKTNGPAVRGRGRREQERAATAPRGIYSAAASPRLAASYARSLERSLRRLAATPTPSVAAMLRRARAVRLGEGRWVVDCTRCDPRHALGVMATRVGLAFQIRGVRHAPGAYPGCETAAILRGLAQADGPWALVPFIEGDIAAYRRIAEQTQQKEKRR